METEGDRGDETQVDPNPGHPRTSADTGIGQSSGSQHHAQHDSLDDTDEDDWEEEEDDEDEYYPDEESDDAPYEYEIDAFSDDHDEYGPRFSRRASVTHTFPTGSVSHHFSITSPTFTSSATAPARSQHPAYTDDHHGASDQTTHHLQLDRRPPAVVQLQPFNNQVGGHNSIFRFSARAVCKPLVSRENEFYEAVELNHTELLAFMPKYLGVLNVTYRTDHLRLPSYEDPGAGDSPDPNLYENAGQGDKEGKAAEIRSGEATAASREPASAEATAPRRPVSEAGGGAQSKPSSTAGDVSEHSVGEGAKQRGRKREPATQRRKIFQGQDPHEGEIPEVALHLNRPSFPTGFSEEAECPLHLRRRLRMQALAVLTVVQRGGTIRPHPVAAPLRWWAQVALHPVLRPTVAESRREIVGLRPPSLISSSRNRMLAQASSSPATVSPQLPFNRSR